MEKGIATHLFGHCRIKLQIAIIIVLLGHSLLSAQLTINITSIPSSPPHPDIYIAGNFNSWDPGNPTYKLTNNNNGTYLITFSPNPGNLEFKFTRGSWETVEGNNAGGFIPNRSYTYAGGLQSTNVTIAGWEGGSGGTTAADNVEILYEDYFMPQLNRTRRIWLYLPPDYHTTSKRYPVIYMQDGQNLFDEYTSFAGEWKIDESLNDLFNDGDYGVIVVGIDNGGGERINEYSPWINPNYGGGNGEAYAAFMVQTLKPHIDSLYRTLSGREYTAIAGSSLGANISMYTAIEYQDVFSKVGIFSPAFWFSDSLYIHLAGKGIASDLRVYFVAGQNESAGIIADMMTMYDALSDAGQDESEMFFLSEPDGAHSEWFWAREFPDTYEWLFENLVLADETPSESYWSVYPNPVKEYLVVPKAPEDLGYTIYSSLGQIMFSGPLLSGQIDTSSLTNGLYFLVIRDPLLQTVFVTRFIKS